MQSKPKRKTKFKACPKCKAETVLAICPYCKTFVQKIEMTKKYDPPKDKGRIED